LFEHYKCTASVESTRTTDKHVLRQYLEAVNDTDAAEGAEQFTDRLYQGLCFHWFCVCQQANHQTKPSKDVEQSVGKFSADI